MKHHPFFLNVICVFYSLSPLSTLGSSKYSPWFSFFNINVVNLSCVFFSFFFSWTLRHSGSVSAVPQDSHFFSWYFKGTHTVKGPHNSVPLPPSCSSLGFLTFAIVLSPDLNATWRGYTLWVSETGSAVIFALGCNFFMCITWYGNQRSSKILLRFWLGSNSNWISGIKSSICLQWRPFPP